jgi:hypothetical protein
VDYTVTKMRHLERPLRRWSTPDSSIADEDDEDNEDSEAPLFSCRHNGRPIDMSRLNMSFTSSVGMHSQPMAHTTCRTLESSHESRRRLLDGHELLVTVTFLAWSRGSILIRDSSGSERVSNRCQVMGKSKGKKRKASEAAIETSIQDVDLPNGWMQKLLALELDLAYVLQVASLANAGQITASGYEGQDNVAQASLSSFVSLNPRS